MRILHCCIIAATTIAPGLAAQVRLETGGGASRLDQLPATSLTAFGGGADASLGVARFQFAGSTEDHVGIGVAGRLASTLHAAFDHWGWHIEAGPSAAAARDIGAPWAGDMSGDVSADREFGAFAIHGGWQLGVAKLGTQRVDWNRSDFAAALHAGNFTFGMTAQSVISQDSVARETFFSDTGAAAHDTIYRAEVRNIHDVGVRFQWASGLLSLSGHLVRRFGTGVSAQTWWESTASLRLTPVMALTMKNGQLASDAVLGTRGGAYTTLGLRVDLLQRTPIRERGDRTAPLQIEREHRDQVRLTFALGPQVRQATLTGDVTDWQPVNLARTDDGRWETVVTAKAGVHRINISTDNGAWRPPPGLPATDDGFGAKVGLLVLEQ